MQGRDRRILSRPVEQLSRRMEVDFSYPNVGWWSSIGIAGGRGIGLWVHILGGRFVAPVLLIGQQRLCSFGHQEVSDNLPIKETNRHHRELGRSLRSRSS